MNKKFLSAILFGALMVTSTGTFVSCKDYDDDIDRIDKELTEVKSAISALQAKVDAGKYVTNVVKNGNGITVTWNDNSTSTIETIKGDAGQDGKDGTVVTIIDGYWAFDGVKSSYPAQGEKGEKGDKGDAGAAGEAAAAGHDAAISENGYWMVWDAATGAYVETEYIAGGVTAAEVKGGWQLTVRDNNGEEQTILVPSSPSLLSITPELNGQSYAQNFNIYYGILNADVDWEGPKAVNKKMLKGMYPTADRDIKMQLNPSNADATIYKWEFVSTDNSTPWGLYFKEPQAWTGKATTATRSAASANGLWFLKRDVQCVDLDEAEKQGRPDYVTQFKSNDGNKYLFALQAKALNGVSVKSDYVYTFKASNVNATKNIYINDLTFNPSGSTFLYGREYEPHFDMLYRSYDNYDQYAEDSVLVYDYYLDIDRSQITAESIRKYGVSITDDGYRFIASNEAVVNNTIPFVYNYILINGVKGSCKFRINFSDEETTVSNQYIGDITAPFNATLASADGRLYAMSKTLDLTNFFNGLGEAGKLKWIDAIARNMWNVTDPKEIISSVFNRRYGTGDQSKWNVELTGGDPINNQATYDVVVYNGVLLNKYITFDYVDATGASCLTGNISDLDKIAALKVTFWVDSELGRVTAPYYTTTGRQYNGNSSTVALPLDNAFRVEIATRYDQYEVARMNFTFELQMPTNCPILRKSVGNQTTSWSGNVLKVYGEKLPMSVIGERADYDFVAADLRDAFQGNYKYQNGAYNNKPNVEGNWYELTVPENKASIIGSTGGVVTLADITASSVYTDWNTRNAYTPGYWANVTDYEATKLNKYTLTNVKYHHFNVYTEELSDIILQFASKVADSQKAQVKSSGTKASPFVAKAVYNADKTLNRYQFSVSNADFTMTDAFDNAYYLFDSANTLRANLHVKLLEDRQGIVVDKTAPSFYGLYPSAKVDEEFTNLVTYTLVGAADNVKTTKMTMTIDKSVGVDKVIEITYHVTDVFGCIKPVTFYVRTVNEAIGNDEE